MDCASGFHSPCASTLAGPASHLFVALINTLLESQCGLEPDGRFPPDYGPILKDGDEFDFIVVGAGSAGSIIANRLSQVRDWNVLLLEAGTYPSALTEIPAMLFSVQDTREDWSYKMEPSKTSCLSLKGGACHCPRGKMMGGSSSMNWMMYIRGNRNDYDGWADNGNFGWDYDSVVKYFKKFENVEGHEWDVYGTDGELGITIPKSTRPVRQVIIDGYQELGYGMYDENKPLGTLDCLMTISQGTRMNTAKAFIEPLKESQNLKVAVNAHVGQLLIDKQTKTVTGLEVRINNKLVKIAARKEVVLSAGAIGSPHILLNSGIGPKQHLESLGIENIHNLEVGEHFQDHLMHRICVTLADSAAGRPSTPLDSLDETYNFFMHRKGALSALDFINFMAFFNTKEDSIFPNIQVAHAIHEKNGQYPIHDLGRIFRYPDDLHAHFLDINKNKTVLCFLMLGLNPKSVGKLQLRSKNPFDPPRIYPNYLSDENDEDLQVLLEGVRVLERLLQTAAFKPYDPEIIYFDIPECREHGRGTDDYWKCSIRHTGVSAFHPVGTCKMGPRNDSTAVVDERLRVHGVKRVRVIDSSIMPEITSGNTNAPTIMIGEKGTELIKEDWYRTILKHDGDEF